MKRLVLLWAVAGAGAAEASPAGGNGTLFLAARPGKILIVDEASFRITGEIPLAIRAGISYPLQLSSDRKRFLSYHPNMEQIEIVEIASRRSVGTVKLSEGATQVRFDCYDGCAESAGRMTLSARAATKLSDRFEIGPRELVEYDLEKGARGRTIPWPEGRERETVGLKYSPDGKLLYVMAEDLYVYDVATLQLVDKWELARPLESGMGRLELGDVDDVNEEPGFFTGLFQVDDPVQHRKLTGVARLDLADKKVDFWTVGPALPLRRFALAPGRRNAYAVLDEPGGFELWTFDLVARRVEKRTPFEGRPRIDLAVSSNGKLLYVYGAGNTVDLYDASTHRFVRTISFDSEVANLYVLPSPR